jgi:hypothetical protein
LGGLGSGRHSGSGKETTSHFCALDVRHLQRKKLLEPGRSFTWQWSRAAEVIASIQVRSEGDAVRLACHRGDAGESWKSEVCWVNLEWTPCHYGGQRAWFRCPGLGCGRRVAILYCRGNFLCRQCHNLSYQSQHEEAHDRALTRVQKIRVQLGGHADLDDPFPSKPKWMHWRTYHRMSLKGTAGSRCGPNWALKLPASGK